MFLPWGVGRSPRLPNTCLVPCNCLYACAAWGYSSPPISTALPWEAGALGSTVMVPRIQGCGRQKYQYTPGSSKVKLKLCPAARSPESHTSLSEVVVWTVGPWFVQV